MAKNSNFPSVLAFEKKLVPSDGYMYGTTWEERNEKTAPLKLIEKSVRGTISNRLKKALKSDPIKLDAEVEKANLQTVDNCALGAKQDTLKLYFTLKILSGVESPSTCNNSEFNKTYKTVAKKYIEEEGFVELSRRYATNIANARFLWRNRLGAENIEVRVKELRKDVESGNDIGSEWVFDSSTIGLNFTNEGIGITTLTEKIAEALSGRTTFLLLEIEAFAKVGRAQDVYPSEELVLDKGKGKKGKILYAIDGVAGMHSQKIGNALRTIDTWYPEFDSAQIGPIAIEPYGAVTNLGKAYRTPTQKADFYTLFDNFACGGSLERKEDEHYVMAALVRGGVFGKSGKE